MYTLRYIDMFSNKLYAYRNKQTKHIAMVFYK